MSAAIAARHPLIARLAAEHGCPQLDATGLQAFLELPGHALLFCAGDPVQHPECLDVAVILPELLRAFPGRFHAATAAPELEPALQTRYGFSRWPALVLLRHGEYLGAIAGIQDWGVYLERIDRLLHAEPSRPPSVGIAVRAAGASTPSCH